METTFEFLKRAAEKCGFNRETYQEKNTPTNRNNIQVFHFFGDVRSEFILSSLLLKRFKEEIRGSRYLILCSWSGHKHLYPYADEYWSPDQSICERLWEGSIGFKNITEVFSTQQRNLNWFFENLSTSEDILDYYDDGIKKLFFDRLSEVRRTLPVIPSVASIDVRISQELTTKPGYKVLFCPMKLIRGYRHGKQYQLRAPKEFWIKLANRLISDGNTPVVIGGIGMYDISPDVPAIHYRIKDYAQLLSLMRSSSVVLDVFNGTSRLALCARSPFIAVDERSRYSAQKEYEIDALCGQGIPRQYIFSFPTLIEQENEAVWRSSIFDCVSSKIASFLPTIDRERLPHTGEQTIEVPYSTVKAHKSKRIGARFVKIPKE